MKEKFKMMTGVRHIGEGVFFDGWRKPLRQEEYFFTTISKWSNKKNDWIHKTIIAPAGEAKPTATDSVVDVLFEKYIIKAKQEFLTDFL